MFNISACHWFYMRFKRGFQPFGSKQDAVWHRNIYHRQLAGKVMFCGFVGYFLIFSFLSYCSLQSSDHLHCQGKQGGFNSISVFDYCLRMSKSVSSVLWTHKWNEIANVATNRQTREHQSQNLGKFHRYSIGCVGVWPATTAIQQIHITVQFIKTKPKRKQVLACGNHAWLRLYVNESEFNCVWNGISNSNRNSSRGSKIHFLGHCYYAERLLSIEFRYV